MRSRSQSGVRLDQLMIMVEKTILNRQDPVTGLFANNPTDFPGNKRFPRTAIPCISEHAWIRDNVYAAQALWAMYRAFGRNAEFDEDQSKARELGLTW